MDLVLNKIQENVDSEDDDCGSYFLQPASSPYNIAEKVQQANIDLFSTSITSMEKTSRVKFKEELTSYEPELVLTDDDVNSLESDPPESDFVPEPGQVLEYKSSNVINLNIFDINEEEEIEEDVIEEIVPDECDVTIGDNLDNKNTFFEEFIESESTEQNENVTVRITSSDCNTKSTLKRKKVRKKSPLVKTAGNVHIECRNHCIERLDFDMSMSIKKLEIHEKPVKCPLLKLQTRKCCDENKSRNPTNLPCYNGHRSEYGLSSEELEKRERRKEIIKLKEQKRQQLMREYKNRKNQQNEEVFCQWLKDVARRKAQKQKINTGNGAKQCFSPNVISFPTKVCEKINERPKTANEFVPRQNIKRARRPHTSPACVFIEVPQKLLERGIHIGDLLVTNSNFAAKKMHILSVSS
ncbi:uncharacterized protein LOC103315117 [Tribolium castaneum]|uniref:Coiled-coil domain-containing protein 181 n=1 Tax=Tribolium castaneum TaxID=7070 RepID=A0A139WMI6_TRICA|nr:PREDICTED: uncharacterized protein LOC103315117 [Tribolium castaneum]KYB29259.1 hypothetical protein TcasGA2_TC034559 [Tribolium castaneum]|eukprot:XP_008201204.1 PREDICTED: uncharacterized protein LOC103315117 [Tribolium castaneum]